MVMMRVVESKSIAPFHSSSCDFQFMLMLSSTVKLTGTVLAGCVNPHTLATLLLLPVPQARPVPQVPHASVPPQPSLGDPQLALRSPHVFFVHVLLLLLPHPTRIAPVRIRLPSKSFFIAPLPPSRIGSPRNGRSSLCTGDVDGPNALRCRDCTRTTTGVEVVGVLSGLRPAAVQVRRPGDGPAALRVEIRGVLVARLVCPALVPVDEPVSVHVHHLEDPRVA